MTRAHRIPREDRRLVTSLRRLSRRGGQGHAVTVACVLAPLDGEALAMAAALLALPFLSPLSLGPLTIPASLGIGVLAWGMLCCRTQVRLPARIERAPVPRPVLAALPRLFLAMARLKSALARRRWSFLVEGARGRAACATGMIIGAALLAVPVPLLPFTNTLPALSIILFALGWREGDGLLVMAGALAAVAGAALLGGIGLALALAGWEAFEFLGPVLLLEGA